jgi:YVTN family beta-propeller protein
MTLQSRVLSLLFSGLFAAAAFGQTTGASFGTVISLGGTPSDAVWDEVRNRVYLVNSAANRVDILDANTNKVSKNIRVGTFPLAAAISMDGAYLYVTNTSSASLSVIDLGTDSVVTSVSLPAKPEGVAVGIDGRVVITTQGTGTNNALNTLLIYDKSQQLAQQVTTVQFPPAITTPSPLPAVFVGRPATAFPGRLLRTPDGKFIIGMVAINQTTNGATTTLFVYEVVSGVVLINRSVTGQSTVLSMSPDGSRFMAGSTLYDVATLSVIGQQSTANLPFFVGTNNNPNFNIQQNYGGSVFTPDATTIYSAFNTAANGQRATSNVLYISNSTNLGVKLGIKLPESVLGKMISHSSGNDVFALSESGMIYLPMSTLYDYPILQPETTQVFLSVNDCNRGIASAQVRATNLGKGKLTYAVPIQTTAMIAAVDTGLVPSTITLTMDPGRSGVVRQPGTNLYTNAGNGNGGAINVTLSSLEAINYPNVIRVYMNYRQQDQQGVVFPMPTSLNNGESLQDIVLDQARGKVYISNSGYNRVEVFDIKKQRFVDPINVGQLPHSMAMTPDGNTLYVGNSGGESISIVDLDAAKVVGGVTFPPIPRAGNQGSLRPLTMAYSLSGLQFMMSNGTFWRVIGNTATPRLPNSITPTSVAGPYSMTATPGGEYVLLLTGNANASGYLYDALADTYTSSHQLYNQAPVSYFGPAAAGPSGSYFLVNGLILSPSLAVIGGTERPGTTQFGPPPAPGQPPTQTIVSAGQRNVASVYPLNENYFIRLTTPVRQNLTSVTRDDARSTLELVDIRNGAESVLGVFPENPLNNVFGATRVNTPPRQMVADKDGNIYTITVSGLSVMKPALTGTPTRPSISGGNRGVVNSTDGTPNVRPGAFITVTGTNLADAASADSTPLPTLLGGSCVVFNDMPLPLLQSSPTQMSAQIPADVRPGQNVVQIRSLSRATQSDPIIVNVLK